jgi:integrase
VRLVFTACHPVLSTETRVAGPVLSAQARMREGVHSACARWALGMCRALRRRDLQLRREGGEPIGGFVTVREGWSYGQTHTPKTGQRVIPIAPPLARLLGPIEQGPRDGHLALSEGGTPWGQYGLDQAFERVRARVGLEGWSVYCLRHYAITLWLRRGVPVHVVQRMAGHKHLSTTQRYVHFLKEDLEEAGRRIAGGRWVAAPETPISG